MSKGAWHGAKGTIPRATDKQKYDTNFDKIFNKNKDTKEPTKNESQNAK